MSKRETVRAFVADLLGRKGDRGHVTDDEALLDRGRLDSTDVLELVAFAEEKFGVDFAARGFDQGDFNSVDTIVAMLGE